MLADHDGRVGQPPEQDGRDARDRELRKDHVRLERETPPRRGRGGHVPRGPERPTRVPYAERRRVSVLAPLDRQAAAVRDPAIEVSDDDLRVHSRRTRLLTDEGSGDWILRR